MSNNLKMLLAASQKNCLDHGAIDGQLWQLCNTPTEAKEMNWMTAKVNKLSDIMRKYFW